MKAVFSLLDKHGERVTEDALRADPALAAALLRTLGTTEGDLHIEDPDSGVWASLGDTLPVLMGRLCLDGLATLRERGRLEVEFFDREEHLTATIADGTVEFDSSRFGQRSFPAAPYFAALAACGERYQQLLDSLPPAAQEVTADQAPPGDDGW